MDIENEENKPSINNNTLNDDKELNVPPKFIRKSKRRLIISKIKLNNFKSYYGEHTIGPLHYNFTAVIGANGSGKSNLLESLVFVFGARASKMRLKSLKEVIHNSKDHPDCTRAEVTVFFEEVLEDFSTDPASWQPIPHSKFSIGRVVRLTGTEAGSEAWYVINGEKVKSEEVKEKLTSKELDLVNNRFMILQGEVELISLMKPMSGDPEKPGLLEYLEEIIGTNIYVEDIENLAEELEQKVGERKQAYEVCEATKFALKDMDQEKNEAIRYAKAERSLALKKCLFNSLQSHKIGEQIKEKKENEKEVKAQKQTLEDELRKQANENKARLDERNKVSKKLQKLENDVKILKEHKIPSCKTHDVQLKDEEKNYISKQINLTDDIKELDEGIQEVIEKSKTAEENLPEIEAKLNELKKGKQGLEKELDAELTRLAPFTNQKRQEKLKLEEKLDQPKKDLSEISNKIESINSKLEIFRRSDDEFLQRKQHFDQRYKETTENYEIEKVKHDRYKTVLDRINTEKDEKDQNIAELVLEKEKIKNQIDERSVKINDYESQKNTQNNKNHLLNTLQQWQRVGQIRGLKGRLGDLGSIDKKFDFAISNAVAGLDNLVFDTMDNASHTIQLLREHKIGNATCIAIDKIRHLSDEVKRPFQTPENAVRLFDQIEPINNDAKLAFYSSMKNLLVCKDITIGRQVSERGFQRVVTLNGDTIEKTGVFTGGGNNKKSGRMGQNPVVNMNFEEDLQKLKQEVTEFNKQKNEIDENLGKLRQQNDQTAYARQKVADELHILENNQLRLQRNETESQNEEKKLYENLVENTSGKDKEELEKELKVSFSINKMLGIRKEI